MSVGPPQGGARCPACGAALPPGDAVEPHAPRDIAAGRPVPSPTAEFLPESPDLVFACQNPFCQELLSASARNAGRKWRCAVCRCPLGIPPRRERSPAAPSGRVHQLTLPAVDFPGPVRLVRPSGLPFGTAAIVAGVVAYAAMSYLLLVRERILPDAVLHGCWLGGWALALVLFCCWHFRHERLRSGRLEPFRDLREAVAEEDIGALIDGLGQKRRAAKVAACRALISLGPRAAAAVPALIDLLWGTAPLEKNWPPAGPPPYDCCLTCGKRLRFWNRHGAACGSCIPEMGVEWNPDDHLSARGWAARALASIGPVAAPARPALQAVYQLDRVPLVREEAGIALIAIRCGG
jgi:hypothetical protein